MVQAMERGGRGIYMYMYKGREGIGHMYYNGAGIRKETKKHIYCEGGI